ncbi:YihY/virulence factor BrkB family protein [bacterium]|nr:YihY/virulence factor BrkB family protein [bacterium]
MSVFSNLTIKIDTYQRNHKIAGFSYGVYKKYSEDEVGKKVALLTYYGFLSLFPLLLLIATAVSIFTADDPQAQATATNTIARYIPAIGDQLYSHIHSINKNGFALIVALLFTLYGARGAIENFRESAKSIWHEPKKNDPFAKNILRSLIILFVGTIGLVIASIITGNVADAGNGLLFKVLSVLVNVFVLFWVFIFILKTSIDRKISIKKIRLGALISSVGLVLLQIIGGVLLAHQLKTLDTLYSVFALPLGLMFWIYLQSQVVYIAVIVSAVNSKKLWPRAIDQNNPTTADSKV